MQLDRDGYHDVPNDKLVSVVTYLEMSAPPTAGPAERPEFALRRVDRPDLGWYRDLYGRVGLEWLWVSRLNAPDRLLRDELDDPLVEVYALSIDGRDEGLAELDRRRSPEVEIVYFGLTAAMIGKGAGSWLMARTLQEAWRYGTRRVWLHTCTLDHPNAIDFYRRMGFRPYKRAVEIVPDPRVKGDISRDVAPHFPPLA
ncbi:Acetyltransferase (GNAT) family protein [Arboricoccus pini]|uniref:Acetyltransferase (GNAT) family protein n=1 Tax=Arboricoccus pini TaxID=1963835 RepID=A0A212PX60_9PROT|nr:GNAT family N-acetyltransferase [Arboricoccus pini]SNB51508.1 Acetyltransferase (GNAT) family protein [Arboricoccus pini]